MLDNNCVETFKKLSFWNYLNPKEQSMLCNGTKQTKFCKGENIHGIDGKCTGAIFVKNGFIRVYMLSDEGREITLYRINKGDMCILSASCVVKDINFNIFVDAESDCEVYILCPNMLQNIMNNNIHFENYILKIVAQRFSDVMWVMNQILFMSFDKRLAFFLDEEIKKHNEDSINLTQEQIAKYTGSAREVVSRMLKYFASEGIVEIFRGGVKIINKNKLHKLIES